MEWEYRKLTAEEQAKTAQWWKKVPSEKSLAQLSDRWGRQLGCIVSFGAEQLKP